MGIYIYIWSCLCFEGTPESLWVYIEVSVFGLGGFIWVGLFFVKVPPGLVV